MTETLPNFDLYDALGIGPDADSLEIEFAWRATMWRVHPDHAGMDAEALDAAKRANVARDWLLSPTRRARYEASFGAMGPRSRPTAARSAPPSGRRPSTIAPDFGPHVHEIRAMFAHLRRATSDELDRLACPLSSLKPDGFPGVARHC